MTRYFFFSYSHPRGSGNLSVKSERGLLPSLSNVTKHVANGLDIEPEGVVISGWNEMSEEDYNSFYGSNEVLTADWTEFEKTNLPPLFKAVWIETDQGHINLAWYDRGRFWPYGGDIHDGRQPFGDKSGGCNVSRWKYAELPEGVPEVCDECFCRPCECGV